MTVLETIFWWKGAKVYLTISLLKANVASIAATTAVITATIQISMVVTSSVLVRVVNNHTHVPVIGVGRCNDGTSSVARCHDSSAEGINCIVVPISRLDCTCKGNVKLTADQFDKMKRKPYHFEELCRSSLASSHQVLLASHRK